MHAGVLRPVSRVPSPHGLARADGNSRPLPLPHFDILYSPQFSSALKIKNGDWREYWTLTRKIQLHWTEADASSPCCSLFEIAPTFSRLKPPFLVCFRRKLSIPVPTRIAVHAWNYAEISDSLQPPILGPLKSFIQIPGFYHAIRAKARDIYCFFHNAFSFQNSISRFGLNYHCIFQCKA